MKVLYIIVVNVFTSDFSFKNTKKGDIGTTDSQVSTKNA